MFHTRLSASRAFRQGADQSLPSNCTRCASPSPPESCTTQSRSRKVRSPSVSESTATAPVKLTPAAKSFLWTLMLRRPSGSQHNARLRHHLRWLPRPRQFAGRPLARNRYLLTCEQAASPAAASERIVPWPGLDGDPAKFGEFGNGGLAAEAAIP